MFEFFGKIDCVWTRFKDEVELVKEFIREPRSLTHEHGPMNLMLGDTLSVSWNLDIPIGLRDVIKIGYIISIVDLHTGSEIYSRQDVATAIFGRKNTIFLNFVRTKNGFEQDLVQQKLAAKKGEGFYQPIQPIHQLSDFATDEVIWDVNYDGNSNDAFG